ncbi:carbohydrate-binding protein [uncultured Corynebacterium sp.]|uniref:carbohydrate-binding protein n=1 Tax=uncultured Corynebacterium sp. TaxID=159447 RepID=UPI00263752F4|nr:carbohydrate-binding protein [uncultured Corynebacterium sp.]
MIDLTTYTEDQLLDLQQALADERKRRAALPAVEKAQTEVVEQLREDGKLPPLEVPTDAEAKANPDSIPAWDNPGTDHAKMYTADMIVRHNGRVWRSATTNLNSWEPGAPGVYDFIWEDVTDQYATADADSEGAGESAEAKPGEEAPEAKPPEFKQPTGAHDAYKIGDRVTYQGVVYESTIDSNVWSPSDYPQGWKKV